MPDKQMNIKTEKMTTLATQISIVEISEYQKEKGQEDQKVPVIKIIELIQAPQVEYKREEVPGQLTNISLRRQAALEQEEDVADLDNNNTIFDLLIKFFNKN